VQLRAPRAQPRAVRPVDADGVDPRRGAGVEPEDLDPVALVVVVRADERDDAVADDDPVGAADLVAPQTRAEPPVTRTIGKPS
jgi:hypothetical protein